MIAFLSQIERKTPFTELLLFAVIEIGVPEDELFELEFYQFEMLLEAFEKKESKHDARMANIMALIANINRDPKKQQTPFSVKDFMPQRNTDADQDPETKLLLALGVPIKTKKN